MKNYSTIMFDLDGTLAESKAPLTTEMAALLAELMSKKNVAVISGGGLPQFLTQIVDRLPLNANLAQLYLLPTSGAALYTYDAGEWREVYEESLSEDEARSIEEVIRDAAKETGLIDFSESVWGERIEYRKAQVTLSALGQQAPIEAKRQWDPDHTKRQVLVALIAPRLPQFSIKIGGTTSIDVTKKGIDKAYGVQELSKFIHEPIESMLYMGDALFPGGNDEAVKRSGIETKQVADPSDTARVIEEILSAS